MQKSFTERVDAPVSVRRPGAHLGLRWSTLTRGDVPAMVDLAARCVPVDQPRITATASEIPLLFAVGRSEELTDALGGFDTGGRLQAMAWVRCPRPPAPLAIALISAAISPTWRGRGIGRALLDWQDGRARQLLVASGHDGVARIADYVDDHLVDRRRVHAAAGFSPKTHHLVVERDLDVRRPAQSPPHGREVAPWDPAEAEETRELHARTLADLGARVPLTRSGWADLVERVTPRWSRTLWDRTGDGRTPVAVALTTEENPPGTTDRRAHVELVIRASPEDADDTTLALLEAVASAVSDGGATTLRVDIDTADPARSLSVLGAGGFRLVSSRSLYSLEL